MAADGDTLARIGHSGVLFNVRTQMGSEIDGKSKTDQN